MSSSGFTLARRAPSLNRPRLLAGSLCSLHWSPSSAHSLSISQAGLSAGESPERRAQLDVVSDLLEQANSLLEDNRYHPAAAAILIGASLEESLRTWIEAEALSIGNAKPGIDAYCKALRSAELISKQDVKTSPHGPAFETMQRTANGMKSATKIE